MATRWVTFDCYGTLVDWKRGFAEALAPVAGDRASDIVRLFPAWQRRIERRQPHQPYTDTLVAALRGAAGAAGLSLSEDEARAVPRSWGEMPLFADVEPALAELRRLGFALAVLTNCDSDLFAATHPRFARPFDLVVTAERIRGYKPAPWHFRAFELMTRVRRHDWVHVASTWDDDIEPAQALGVNAVWLDRDGDVGRMETVPRVSSAADAVVAISALSVTEAHGRYLSAVV